MAWLTIHLFDSYHLNYLICIVVLWSLSRRGVSELRQYLRLPMTLHFYQSRR